MGLPVMCIFVLVLPVLVHYNSVSGSTIISVSSEENNSNSTSQNELEEINNDLLSMVEDIEIGASANYSKPKITRCCGYKGLNQNCSANEDLPVKVYNLTNSVNVSENYFEIVTTRPCNRLFTLDPNQGETWFLQENGFLFIPETFEGETYINSKDFCLYFSEGKSGPVEIQANICINNKFQEIVDANRERILAPMALQISMLISMPFLLMTLLVYACVPDLQNIHGKCLICYVISLLTAYLFLVCVQLDTSNTDTKFCLVAPFIIYFAFMVSFMWLHVMCIDIWWTFSGLRGYKGSAKKSEQKRFLLYSLYAWGVPLIMLAITLALQFAPDLPDWLVTPQIAVTKCWFPDDKTVGYYFYGPILLIILVNLGLFTYTTLKIWKVQRSTDQSMKNESQRHGTDSDQQRYKLYLKLMFVFGVNWLMEIISWLANGPHWLWYVTDMCNALYGVFIFFIFVCKANVWKLVRKRYHVMMGRPYLAQTFAPTSSTRSTAVTSSSAGNGAHDSFALTTSTAA